MLTLARDFTYCIWDPYLNFEVVSFQIAMTNQVTHVRVREH